MSQCQNCNAELYDYTFCKNCGHPNEEKVIDDLFGNKITIREYLEPIIKESQKPLDKNENDDRYIG